tara:strand:+ start:666 stop:1319 length:654 start_codon:yes stop_codon:yes gene_type:complete
MIKLDAIYKNKKFRASSLSEFIWFDLLEDVIIYYLGILKEFTLSFSCDSYGYSINIYDINTCKTIIDIEKNNSYDHYYFVTPFSQINVEIHLINKSIFKEVFNHTRFFYEIRDPSDVGIVDSAIEVECDVQNIDKIKFMLIPELTREIQYAILRNKNGISLDSKNQILYYAEFEYFYMQSKVLNINFLKNLKEKINNKKVLKNIIEIYNQIEGKIEV